MESPSARLPLPTARTKYGDFVDLYAALTDNERRRYRLEYEEDSMAVVWMFQRARDEGRVEGERAMLERLVRGRFGQPPRRVAERLRGASEAELEMWADNVLDAATLEEVFASPR